MLPVFCELRANPADGDERLRDLCENLCENFWGTGAIAACKFQRQLARRIAVRWRKGSSARFIDKKREAGITNIDFDMLLCLEHTHVYIEH